MVSLSWWYHAVLLASASGQEEGNCRDRLTWPFASSSIWNTPVGDAAIYADAGIYKLPPPPPGPPPPPLPTNGCTAGKLDPAARLGCPGWQPSWTVANCEEAGCCWDPAPDPDPHGFAWCYANRTRPPTGTDPGGFYVDTDYFVATSPGDPPTPFVDQGWWGSDHQCGRDHCCIRNTSKTIGTVIFPHNLTVGNRTSGGNNAAAVLLPDRDTLVQFQPLYRCSPGSPILSLGFFFNEPWANLSITGDGALGAHGGSHLSSIGGTIRRGELDPDAPPIRHALKLMLWAKEYYWAGTADIPCYRWPATNCDGPASARANPSDPNYYNGSNPDLKPGALLAVPPNRARAVNGTLRTAVGRRLLDALTNYGGYLDDNTAGDAGAFNVEDGVEAEVATAYGGMRLHVSQAADQPLYRDLLAIYKELHIVQNNKPGNVGGGGRRRRPTAPPICP